MQGFADGLIMRRKALRFSALPQPRYTDKVEPCGRALVAARPQAGMICAGE